MFRRLSKSAALAALVALPMSAQGHPHMFIDAGLSLFFDEAGQLTGVRVVWVYDEFTSLLIVEDRGLDPDADGVMTEAELTGFAGTDVDWTSGFLGDLYLSVGDQNVSLGPATDFDAAYENGFLASMHTRPLVEPLDLTETPVAIKVYDPSFYAAYTVALPLAIEQDVACGVSLEEADLQKAGRKLEEMINALPEDQFAEVQFPEVGAFYADTIFVTCDAGS